MNGEQSGFQDQEIGIQPMDTDDNGYLGVSKIGRWCH
jgi:hypothetical protein